MLKQSPQRLGAVLQCYHRFRGMQVKYDALIHNETWSLGTSSSNQNVIGYKCLFKILRNLDGSKARIIAKGFHQAVDVDYTGTFSPMVKLVNIGVFFTLPLARD